MNTPLAIADLKLEHFTTKSERDGSTIVVRLHGNADGEVQTDLNHLLDQVHAEAKRLSVTQAVVNLQDLYFMNSSCISLLVRWINGLSQDKGAHKYRIRFVSNPNLRWQKRILSALSAMGQQVVIIE
jgi:anti-anti-sigma factor